jgi:threonine dehydratase
MFINFHFVLSLAADGRLARFVVEVSDRPGSVAGLTKVIADIGANLLDMSHQRAWVHNNIHATQIQCIVETRSQEHTLELEAAISADGFDIMEFGNGNGSEGEHVSVHQGFPGSS